MKTIYKYTFGIRATQYISIPREHQIVKVGLDPQRTPCIWAIVAPDAVPETMELRIIGTGHECPEGKHLGSFAQGEFVWHVFTA